MDADSSSSNLTPTGVREAATSVAVANAPTTATTVASPATLPEIAANPAKMIDAAAIPEAETELVDAL